MKLEATMEDHLEDQMSDGSPRGVSKRRANKHLIERRRRARINSSLTQLKSLVLEGLKKDPARYNRLEKADILEMTVNHLKSLKTQQNEEDLVSRYQAGFTECAGEIAHFLNGLPKMEESVKTNILSHMNEGLIRMGQSLGVATAGEGTSGSSTAVEPPHDPSMPLDLSRSSKGRLKPLENEPFTNAQATESIPGSPVGDFSRVALAQNCHVTIGVQLEENGVSGKKDNCVESVDSGLDDEISSNDDNVSNDVKTDDYAHYEGDNRDIGIRQDDMWRPW